jgi:hypothetical protein
MNLATSDEGSMVCPCSATTLGRRGDAPGDGEGLRLVQRGRRPVQRGALAERQARGRGAPRLEMGRGAEGAAAGAEGPAAGRGAGWASAWRNDRQHRRKRWEESEGSGGPRERSGARGGELREGYVEENVFAFLGIEGKDPDQKKRSPVVFRILREATVEKIELRIEAFGGILAFFHQESDFNRNQTGP